MANDFAAQQQMPTDQMNGSIEDAALAMPDLGPSFEEMAGLEQPKKAQPRDPASQQWRSPTEEAEAKQAKEPEQPEQPETAEEASPVDEEFFEMMEERDGKQVPVRLKASEVWAEAQEAKRLRQEMEEVRSQNIAPEQWDAAILQANQARSQVLRQLQMVRAMISPELPDERLLDENNPAHNPTRYHQQLAAYRKQSQQIQQVEAQIEHYEQEQSQQAQMLQAAHAQREKAKLLQFWPELKDQKEAASVRDNLVRHYGKYGVTDALINSVTNAAFYALAKDALAYRKSLQVRETAIKVVRTKPKLVRAQARDTTAPNNRRAAAGMARLQQSGSLEDAASALDGLL